MGLLKNYLFAPFIHSATLLIPHPHSLLISHGRLEPMYWIKARKTLGRSQVFYSANKHRQTITQTFYWPGCRRTLTEQTWGKIRFKCQTFCVRQQFQTLCHVNDGTRQLLHTSTQLAHKQARDKKTTCTDRKIQSSFVIVLRFTRPLRATFVEKPAF